jgi:hypothetical protein
LTKTHPLAGDIDLLVLCFDHRFGGRKLTREFCSDNGGGGDICRKGQLRARQFMAPVVHTSGQRFQRTTIPPAKSRR